jgi:hypothetical protein
MLKFGTIDPCGILRAQIRQEAGREGGFGGVVASTLPDVVIDGIIAAQYGPLSPVRCIALAFAGAPVQAPTVPRPVPPRAGQQGGFTAQNGDAALKHADEETKTAKWECKNKLLSGELKKYIAIVECSNPRIVAAYEAAGYRNIDLIYLITAKRSALAEQVDNGTLTEAQAELQFTQFMVRIDDEARQRDKGQR